ncbi:MAG: adenosylcobinamide-GDP ribazoletransferase [Thaumarchaeota archaeon]|nr:adenosylcobinamide-GDP ribazoletransferase [Nitrososphaerota archaeon]MBT4056695.1 adenosylcobinamide-GDP ribazoletransferase [Nitrososphaerota archaeon]MBT4510013.1 adenosylcobinamide-GDP ribazoletransferase [Nitrososphaerota archaeon]MBT4973273.1 adenosylcobinamide-GDP ribazoletransferase [Nitrososphaerota archaeon]MBT5238383.1 adenosylcobinamide-GDP ribazoletransferase [Nitrososphaerota archaeon]
MLKQIGSVFSFLTIIPTSNSDLNSIAKNMFLFPIVGIVIGLIIGSLGYGLSLYLEPLVVSLVVVASLAVITGIHHTDGLADFADGLMTKGTKEKKRKAMKDLSVGSAGIFSIVMYAIGMIIALSFSSGMELFKIILLSEIMAKFSMVLMAGLGNSASIGSNSPFIDSMKDKKRLLIAGIITIIPLLVIGEMNGLIVFASGIIVTMFLVGLSTKSFGGITGDVMGACNELTRLSSLLIFVSL